MPSPTIATTRPSRRRCSTHSALSAGVSSASTCLMWTFFATARAGAARSPVRIVRSLRPRCFRSWIDVVRLAPDPVAGADHARRPDRRAPRSEAVCPDRSSASRRRSTSAGDRHAVLANQAEVADEQRRRRASISPGPDVSAAPARPLPAGPGSRRTSGRASPRRRASATSKPAERDARSAARPRRPAGARRSGSSLTSALRCGCNAMQSPSSGLPSVRVPVLSKATRRPGRAARAPRPP